MDVNWVINCYDVPIRQHTEELFLLKVDEKISRCQKYSEHSVFRHWKFDFFSSFLASAP